MTDSLDDEKSSSESSGEQLGGSHWIVNIDDMIERDLDHPEYWELMQGEGKVIEFQPPGVSDFPSVLVGFTEEQVYDEILPLLYTLPLADLLETVHSVLRKYRIHYECKNLLGTDTYIFDFPKIEGGKLMYIEVRPKLISPGYSLYDGFSFPDATYDLWGEWGRLLDSQMTRRNLEKAIDHWRAAQYGFRAPGASVLPVERIEHPNRKAAKDEIRELLIAGYNLTEIAQRNSKGIPYSTVRVYRDELISEGRLPSEFKRHRKKLKPDSI